MSKPDATSYLKAVHDALARGNATEHTHRPALKTFIESFGEDLTATNEPKQEECGAPDFQISRKSIPLGHMEAKDVGKDLDAIEKSDQLKRYLQALPNLILTDYLEFRWYVFGEHRLTAKLDTGSATSIDEVCDLVEAFLEAKVPTVRSPRELASRMGGMARLMRTIIRNVFDKEGKQGSLHTQLKGFRSVLIETLSEDEFADMYAQTICYGLFAACCNHDPKETFTRERAAYELPKTNPFLREIFGHIAGPDLDERLTWVVDDLAELLDKADIERILKDFGKRTRREDPVVHFYETFLTEYDPKVREMRGVYYTPEPVVSYIVRSVDHILKTDFGLTDGLADTAMIKVPKGVLGGRTVVPRVTILDPAVGTGTFLHEVIDCIRDHLESNSQMGAWSSYVSQFLLPRIFGFEFLMAPYAVCHLKLGLQLAETGYDFRANERLRVYLTNTLEEAHEIAGLPLFTQALAREAAEAGEVKQDYPVMVVLGNPPYSGHSANKGKWIHELLRGKDLITNEKTESYFKVDGQKLRERNPKYLNDDYVKFIRFSQWRIERTGHGVLAFITNHGYLDNPTFRGMRQSLMATFDNIYILDLHGNTKKKETAPDGTADKNVFDIQQGVTIGVFTKKAGVKKDKPATVSHAELWGSRDGVFWANDTQVLMGGKYAWLYDNDVTTTKWTTITPDKPWYLFKPMDGTLYPEYMGNRSIVDFFQISTNGFKTHRDFFAIAFEQSEIQERVESLVSGEFSIEQLKDRYGLDDTSDWSLKVAIEELKNRNNHSASIVPCLYQPFDIRFTLYGTELMNRPRMDTGHHALHENICLAVGRQGLATGDDIWNLVAVGKHVANTNLFRRGGIQYFPIYLYPKAEREHLFDSGADTTDAPGGRSPNLMPDLVEDVAAKTGLSYIADRRGDLEVTFGPEDVMAYICAILHSATYRERYAEFLDIDFPRIPLTSSAGLFHALCSLGTELITLHLMDETGPAITAYPIDGGNVVEKVKYTEPKEGQPGCVWINKDQYFEGVPEEVWNFHVGGYQVCQKWLKDRKGRTLDFQDIQHYQHIVSALSEIIHLMAEVDAAIDNYGSWPIS